MCIRRGNVPTLNAGGSGSVTRRDFEEPRRGREGEGGNSGSEVHAPVMTVLETRDLVVAM